MIATTARAARQLQDIDTRTASAILDRLDATETSERTQVLDLVENGERVRCFVARHRDGSRVLLGVAVIRPP